MSKCSLTIDDGAIAVKAPYDAGFVAELKTRVPPTERRWKPDTKQWVVSVRHGKTVQDLCLEYFGETPLLPQVQSLKPTPVQKILDVRYIGTTKDRGGDERSAFGWWGGGWNVVFTEAILRAWFDAPSNPDEQPTLYSVLGVHRDATADELKSAYRRMVMQWHPDRCREPNAQDQFMAIQHAWDILKDDAQRERYNAGLALEMSLRNNPAQSQIERDIQYNGYRSPLRCGLIMATGIEAMGLFNVTKIHAWEDVRDSLGRVLVVSWGKGDDKFTEVWA